MVFCFPCKNTSRYFSDDTPSTSKPSKTMSAEQEVSPAPASAATTTEEKSKGGPKIAIIIYTMYGHIAKSMFTHSPIELFLRLTI